MLVCVCACAFTDVLCQRWTGASMNTIGLSSSLRAGFAILSSMWMPVVSDRRGRKFVMLMSLSGSMVGYATQGYSHLVPFGGAVYVFLLGRSIAGLFSGTGPVIKACHVVLGLSSATVHVRDLGRPHLTHAHICSGWTPLEITRKPRNVALSRSCICTHSLSRLSLSMYERNCNFCCLIGRATAFNSRRTAPRGVNTRPEVDDAPSHPNATAP